MSKRLTAEQVANRLDHIDGEMYEISPDKSVAYGEAAELIREHLIETDEQRRERFERWAGRGRGVNLIRNKSGEYRTWWIEDNWQAWQAALTWHGETEGGGS